MASDSRVSLGFKAFLVLFRSTPQRLLGDPDIGPHGSSDLKARGVPLQIVSMREHKDDLTNCNTASWDPFLELATLCDFPHTLGYWRVGPLASGYKRGFEPLCAVLNFPQLGLPLGQRGEGKKERKKRTGIFLTLPDPQSPFIQFFSPRERLS